MKTRTRNLIIAGVILIVAVLINNPVVYWLVSMIIIIATCSCFCLKAEKILKAIQESKRP